MAALFDTIVNLCKRRGLIFPSSEIYGGVRSTWDYGPLGVELKRNVKDAWWKHVVRLRDDVVGLDAAILMHPRTWEASGHIETFSDPLVECGGCNQRFRADHLPSSGSCPNCGKKEFGDPKNFNLMFKTFVGPVEDATSIAWLRPETAQGIFVNFKTVQQASRKKLPFGIAQIGKSFRNEITPGNFTYRTREFEQMEMEFFCEPGTDEEWHQFWIDARFAWYTDHGIDPEKLRLREHAQDELSHYSKRTVDIEYAFPWTEWGELEGIANRSDYDLQQHMKFSGQDLTYYEQATDTRLTPYVIEPAAGADRATLAFLIDAYREEEARTHDGKTEQRVWLKLHPALAPTKVAVLPLSKKPELAGVTNTLAAELRKRWNVETDDSGSIGRRYRRQDEVGTPYCVTVDFDTLEDQAVTVRDRDTMLQERIALSQVVTYLTDRFGFDA